MKTFRPIMMKRNILLTLIFVLFVIVGIRAEITSIQKQSVGTQAVTTNQQETILQLQEENKKLKEQLESVENKVDVYWDVSKTKIDDVNDNQSHWLVILTIIVTLISSGLGVVAPYIQNKEMQAKLEEAKEQAAEAVTQANEAIKLKKEIEDIRTKIKNDKEKVEQAAKEAKVNQLSAQATLAYKKGNNSEAIRFLNESLKIDENNPRTYLHLCYFKCLLGNFDDALNDIEKSIELNPYDAEAYDGRGYVKANQGFTDDALKDYEVAIKLNPQLAETYKDRAVCYRKMAEEEKNEEKKKEYLALAKADEKKYRELTGGKKK